MKTIELMGPKVLTYIDYVGWLKTDEGNRFIQNGWIKSTTTSNYPWVEKTIFKAQTHLSQLVNKHMFVRPEEPDENEYVTRINPDGSNYMENPHEYEKALHQYENWKPMFTGSWRYDDDADAIIYEPESGGEYWLYCYDYKGWSLDAFIRDLTKDDVPLFYHPEHEMI